MEEVQLINKSNVRSICPINIGGDFRDALNKEAIKLVKKAIERAIANNRRTIYEKDL